MHSQFKFLFLFVIGLSLLSFSTAQAKWESDVKGCKIWVDGKTTENTPKWSGQCKNGFASGKGTVIYNYSNTNGVKSCSGVMKKGKIKGYAHCLLKTGDSFSGTIKDDKIIGKAVYKWKVQKNCPTCPQTYNGTFKNGNFALGTIILYNKQKVKLQFHSTQKGCLVWNSGPRSGEIITWTGDCQDGYANGQGVLKYETKTETETTHGTLKNGMIEGYAVVDVKCTSACQDSIVHYEGIFKSHQAIKGIVTLGNGRKVEHNIQQQVASGNANMEQQMTEEIITNEIVRRTANASNEYWMHGILSSGISTSLNFSPYQ